MSASIIMVMSPAKVGRAWHKLADRLLPAAPAAARKAAVLALVACWSMLLLSRLCGPSGAGGRRVLTPGGALRLQAARRATPSDGDGGSTAPATGPGEDNQPPPVSGFGHLGRPFVINMEHRTDRMAAFTQRMTEAGITNVTVVRGVPHECGQLGLTLAHITALQQCWASPWVDACLIMEDDFAVRAPLAKATALIDSFFRDVKLWDVLMLSCNLQAYCSASGDCPYLPPYATRVLKGLSAAGYVVQRAYATTLSDTLLNAVSLLKDECGVYYTNDVARMKLQAKDVWYTFPDEANKRGAIGYQVASFSDVQRNHTNYGVR